MKEQSSEKLIVDVIVQRLMTSYHRFVEPVEWYVCL